MSNETKAPQPPAEAQPVAWLGSNPRTGVPEMCTHKPVPSVMRDFNMRPLIYGDTPPPSAPVGVERILAEMREEGQADIVDGGVVLEWEDDLRNALAQQPAPVAPAGVESSIMSLRDAANEIIRDGRVSRRAGYTEYLVTVLTDAADRLEALAQQPAAVDGAMERAAEEIERYEHTFISTVGASAIIRKHMRAAQQGGGTDE